MYVANENGGGQWYNQATGKPVTDVIINPGESVFICKALSGAPSFMGKVSSSTESAFGHTDKGGWYRIVCVYPACQGLNEMTWKGLDVGDTLYLYDSNSQTYKSPYVWVSGNNVTAGWYNQATSELASDTIDIGQAMFIHKGNAGTASCAPAQ